MKMTIEGIADVNKIFEELPLRESKNLMRATVQDIASKLAKSAREKAPVGATKGLRKGIKAKRERGSKTTIESTVRSAAFQWRYLEYGQGPDGVEHAFMLKAIQEMRPNMDREYLESFTKKLIARLARERKRTGG